MDPGQYGTPPGNGLLSRSATAPKRPSRAVSMNDVKDDGQARLTARSTSSGPAILSQQVAHTPQNSHLKCVAVGDLERMVVALVQRRLDLIPTSWSFLHARPIASAAMIESATISGSTSNGSLWMVSPAAVARTAIFCRSSFGKSVRPMSANVIGKPTSLANAQYSM